MCSLWAFSECACRGARGSALLSLEMVFIYLSIVFFPHDHIWTDHVHLHFMASRSSFCTWLKSIECKVYSDMILGWDTYTTFYDTVYTNYSNLLSLAYFGTRLQVWGTQWESNSLFNSNNIQKCFLIIIPQWCTLYKYLYLNSCRCWWTTESKSFILLCCGIHLILSCV